jgi:hypothetical protein
MVERVARAIANAGAFDETMSDAKRGWEKCDGAMREDYRREARAAIEAMREPTETMISAGYLWAFGSPNEAETNAERTWQAMIDDALGLPRSP